MSPMTDAPTMVGYQNGRMGQMTHQIIQPLVLGEGAMTTIMPTTKRAQNIVPCANQKIGKNHQESKVAAIAYKPASTPKSQKKYANDRQVEGWKHSSGIAVRTSARVKARSCDRLAEEGFGKVCT
jgi:hypothetical protein